MIAAIAVAGLIGGLLVAEVVARLPDPAPLGRAGRVAIAVLNAGGWAFAGNHWHLWWQVVPFALLASALVCVSAIDLRTYRIPNKVVFPALGVSVVLLFVATTRLEPAVGTWAYYRGALVGAALYFGFLLIPHLIYPKGMGMGDVKLALLMGLYLGWGHGTLDVFAVVTSALFVGCVFGIVSGFIINGFRKRRRAFPFGPALAAGCFLIVVQATGAPIT
ncbi:MAG: A24 family peptidase [Acidimicrobiales bacterium]